MRRERAVLAVALARPRQREREVPRERDTAAHRSAGAYRCAAAHSPPARRRGPESSEVRRGRRGRRRRRVDRRSSSRGRRRCRASSSSSGVEPLDEERRRSARRRSGRACRRTGTSRSCRTACPDTSSGPNARAGFRPAPVSGPMHMTAAPSAPPMSHGVMSLLFFAMTAVPVIVAISRNVPIISATKPVDVALEERLGEQRRAVVHGLALVDEEPLADERGERRAGELHEDVDAGVRAADALRGEHRDGDGGVEVRAAHAGERRDEQREHEGVHEADDGPVGEAERRARGRARRRGR